MFKVGDKVSISRNIAIANYILECLEDKVLVVSEVTSTDFIEIKGLVGIGIHKDYLAKIKSSNYDKYKDLKVNTLLEVINHSGQAELLYFSHVQKLGDIIVCFSNGRTSYTAGKDSSGTTSVGQIVSIIPNT